MSDADVMPAEPQAPGRGVLWALFLLSLCAVAFEVSLLRTFAFIFRYHYLFLIVSVAICGYGLGALAHYLLFPPDSAFRIPHSSRAVRLAAIFALSLPVTLALVLRLGVAWMAAWPPAVLLLPVVPFFLAGMTFAELFTLYGAHAGRLYSWDLTGAAVASLAAIGLMTWLGGINTPLALGVLGGVAALLLASDDAGPWRLSRERAFAGGSMLLASALLASNLALGWLDIPRLPAQVSPLLTKPLLRELSVPNSESRIVETRWSAVARIDLVEDRQQADMKYVYTDGDTPTHMLRFDGDLGKVSSLAGTLPFLPFDLARPKRVLAIGSGGGMDVLMALLAGATKVDGVEISRPTIDLVHDYRAFSGDPYRRPGVTAHVMDGRSFVTGSRETYDLIYSALTLTATSGRAGMAHTESYIHTVEAAREYWRHLTGGGVFALVLESETLAMRAFLTALEAMRREGIPTTEAMRHMAMVYLPNEVLGAYPYQRLMLMKRSAFTPAEARRLMRGIEVRRLNAVFVPYELTSLVPFRDLLAGTVTPERVIVETLAEGAGPDLAPVTDDRPFFVFLSRELPPSFKPLMGWLAAVTVLFAATPPIVEPWVRRRRGLTPASEATPFRSALRLLLFGGLFALLGAGFMLLEIPLIQQFILFLGHPTLSLAVVLTALLLGTAAGSAWSQRWPLSSLAARAAFATVCVAVVSLAIFAAVPTLQRLLAGAPLVVRGAVAGFPVWVLGIGLGVPFPSGLRLVRQRDPGYVPWAWGINGLMSVCGSVLAMSLALLWGFHAAFRAGAVAYLLVAVLLALLSHAPERKL